MASDDEQRAATSVELTIQRLVASKSNEESKAVYSAWQTYDEDLDAYGYVAPQKGVEILTGLLTDKHAIIFDAGCGSGKVGALLAQRGYTKLLGSDLSESMLERANALGIYSKLDVADFTQPLPNADNSVDALISIGVWNDALAQTLTPEMLRVVKPGGVVVFSVRPQFMSALDPLLDGFVERSEVGSVRKERSDYITGQRSEAFYISFAKT